MVSEFTEPTHEETLMRINLSGWMRQLWTLHEAVRSRQIYFQFANGLVGRGDLVTSSLQDRMEVERNNPPYFKVIVKQAISILSNISTLRSEDDGHARMSRL